MRRTNIKCLIVIAVCAMVILSGCESKDQIMDGDGMFQTFSYTIITQDDAKRMMEQDDGHVIVDVRRQDEYVEGHIPGAILIPNETIENDPPEELPDYEQIILVYCRSGRRSKEASQKLADMGYKNVYEFGGIIDWTGEVVKSEVTEETSEEITEEKTENKAEKTTEEKADPVNKEVILRFDSFDGGGPEYNVIIKDESIVSYTAMREYAKEDHDIMTGAGYDEVFTFTGIKPGETDMLIEARSPIADNLDMNYKVVVSEDLSVKIEEVSVNEVVESVDEEVDPYWGVLLSYKEAQDAGYTEEELNERGYKTELIQHGWPKTTNNNEVRYHYYDINNYDWIDLIITYYGQIVDIYSHDGDAVYSYGTPYRGIAELYPDGSLSEVVTMGVKGSSTRWYRYDEKSGKFLKADGELHPKESPVIMPEGRKISDVGASRLSD